MINGIPTLDDLDLQGKRVLIRFDYNVKYLNGKVSDDERILRTLPTLTYILSKASSIIILSHLGRPEKVGEIDKDFSLKKVAEYLSTLLSEEIYFHDDLNLDHFSDNQKKISMLENVRFFEGETDNNELFSKKLAQLAEAKIPYLSLCTDPTTGGTTASFAMLGIHHGLNPEYNVIADPELVLPTVIKHYIPTGVKGLLMAGLMAAAMSTFDSTVNAGAAYWVKDLYQTYLRPNATEKDLMFQGRVASLVIVALALLFSLTIKNINEIWGWITMGIGAGMFIPQVIRWYWWRFNGYGFAIGTAFGMIAALLTKAFGGPIPEYTSFLIASGSSLVGCLIGTFFTAPTDKRVLFNFYKITRPFGLWDTVRNQLPDNILEKINLENRRDIIATFFAVPWQVVLFLTGMMIVLKQWSNVLSLSILLLILSAGLYWFWFRHLSSEVKVDS